MLKNLSMVFVVEVGELMEYFFWVDLVVLWDIVCDLVKCGKIEEELVDVVIYVFEFVNIIGIDVVVVIEVKMVVNVKKYLVEKVCGWLDKYIEL